VGDRRAARAALESAVQAFGEALDAYEAGWGLVGPAVEAVIAGNNVVARIDAVGKALAAGDAAATLARYAAILEESQELIRAVEAGAQTKQEDLLKSSGLRYAAENRHPAHIDRVTSLMKKYELMK
jgi:hypothetical protein